VLKSLTPSPVNNQTARRNTPVQCPACGREVPRASRQQKFCSTRCRQQAHYEKLVAEGCFDPVLGQDTALPTNPPKKSNGFNDLRAAKSGSTPATYAPREVIAREIIAGRDWREEISPDGVAVQVARFRLR
jgi:hypothetical protein